MAYRVGLIVRYRSSGVESTAIMSMQSNYPRPSLNMQGGEPCPQCGQAAGQRIRYTWWGGLIGPALLSLTVCRACGHQFNSKTGQPAKKGIIVYNVIAFATVIVFVVAYYVMRG